MDENQNSEAAIKVEKELIEIYNKEDIMNMLNCESAKVLRLLRLMHQMNVAFKSALKKYGKIRDFESSSLKL